MPPSPMSESSSTRPGPEVSGVDVEDGAGRIVCFKFGALPSVRFKVSAMEFTSVWGTAGP